MCIQMDPSNQEHRVSEESSPSQRFGVCWGSIDCMSAQKWLVYQQIKFQTEIYMQHLLFLFHCIIIIILLLLLLLLIIIIILYTLSSRFPFSSCSSLLSWSLEEPSASCCLSLATWGEQCLPRKSTPSLLTSHPLHTQTLLP